MCIADGNVKWLQLLWKTVWQFLKKLNTELPYDPAIPLLGIYPKELKAGTRINICIPTFMATLFTIPKKWKQTKCPSTKEWITDKLRWHIHTIQP